MIHTSLVAGYRSTILLLAAWTVVGWNAAGAQTEAPAADPAAATAPAEAAPAAEPSAAAEATEAVESAAGEAVDSAGETAEAAGNAAETATQEVGEAAAAAGDAVAEAAGDAKQAVDEAAEEVEEAVEEVEQAAEQEGNLIIENLQPPQLAPWHGLHPVVVHVPIGLLLPVPVLIVIGMLSGKLTSLRWATFLLLLGGTLAMFVAVNSGNAAGEYASVDEVSEPIMLEHQQLAQSTCWFYVVACALYLLVLAGPVLGAWANSTGYWVVMHLLLLAVLGISQILLANVGHLGGELVHIHGITAELE